MRKLSQYIKYHFSRYVVLKNGNCEVKYKKNGFRITLFDNSFCDDLEIYRTVIFPIILVRTPYYRVKKDRIKRIIFIWKQKYVSFRQGIISRGEMMEETMMQKYEKYIDKKYYADFLSLLSGIFFR